MCDGILSGAALTKQVVTPFVSDTSNVAKEDPDRHSSKITKAEGKLAEKRATALVNLFQRKLPDIRVVLDNDGGAVVRKVVFQRLEKLFCGHNKVMVIRFGYHACMYFGCWTR